MVIQGGFLEQLNQFVEKDRDNKNALKLLNSETSF